MKQVKLTPTQDRTLSEAVQQLVARRAEFLTAQAQMNAAANHHQAIMEMIYEAHGIDKSTIDPKTKFNLKDSVLTIGFKEAPLIQPQPQAANQRIRSAVKKNHKVKQH